MSKKPEKETSSVEKLKEALFIDKKSGAAKISDSELKKADAFCGRLRLRRQDWLRRQASRSLMWRKNTNPETG